MFGFRQPDLATRSRDGHNVILLEPLVFETKSGIVYRGIVGAKSDGASVPQEFWDVYPPFGDYWLAAVLHDCAYRTMLERQQADGTWMRVQLSKQDCDNLLLEAMESLGVIALTTSIIFQAVSKAGAKAFSDDLAQPIPK